MTSASARILGGMATTLILVASAIQVVPAAATGSTANEPSPKPGKTPSKTDAKQIREGVQVNVEDRMVTRRKTKQIKKATLRKPADADLPPRQKRDDPPISSLDDLKLNIGICGLREPDGKVPGPARCQPTEPEERELPKPTTTVRTPQPQDVTWEQIRAQYAKVLFPRLGVTIQPTGWTLVNLDTIVYTADSRISTVAVSLLGFPVVVEATPMTYRWDFGDGATVTTTSPGKPYPAKEITHKYMKRASVQVALTTNYASRFNVAGTGWQYVNGTIPVTGPASPLLVREAVPVLVDSPR